jgi:ABC-2 type transport system ATP-binding protein
MAILNTAPLIEAIGLQKSFGDTIAVKGIDLQVRPGEIFGFLGPNGAGKTTTIKMLIGLLRPSAGVARIGGHDIQREPIAAKSLIGYVPDQPYLPEKLTAREFLEFIAGLYQLDRAGGYSHGMRQKTALAGALLHNPQAFFLDEPTVGLDPRSARLIKDILREVAGRGTSVFLTTHILEIAERMCDRVAIISGGRLIATGTIDELRAGHSGESLEDIFLELTGGSEDAEIADALA